MGYSVADSHLNNILNKLQKLEQTMHTSHNTNNIPTDNNMNTNNHNDNNNMDTNDNISNNINNNNRNNKNNINDNNNISSNDNDNDDDDDDNNNMVSEMELEHFFSNTTDTSNWLDTMFSEINSPPCSEELPSNDPLVIFNERSSSSEYDLTAIIGQAILRNNNNDSANGLINNRPIVTPSSSMASQNVELSSQAQVQARAQAQVLETPRSVLVLDNQDNGVRLVHMLMGYAQAVQQNNFTLAEALVKQVGTLALSQTGAIRKVGTYFAEALARRIYKMQLQNPLDNSRLELLQMHFYNTCPFLKLAHFAANHAILEAFHGKSRVHIIDFGINEGMQWPSLMQALSIRPGGPPHIRLTGIGPPAIDGSDHLQQIGWKLAQLAETVNLEFEFKGFMATNLAELDTFVLNIRDDECVVINSVFELHKLLNRLGSVEKLLQVVKEINPEILTIIEQESNHNGPVFINRFAEALYYYSTMFDSLEGSINSHDKLMTEVYFGKQICNIVACEGLDRVERHETLAHWRGRLVSTGFVPIHFGSEAFKQASALLNVLDGGEGYSIQESNGALLLGWHTRPLISTSAWRVAGFRLQQGFVFQVDSVDIDFSFSN